MGKLSSVKLRRLPLEIDIFPCLYDHCFEGRAVYPAVEAMQVLAESATSFLSGIRENEPADVTFRVQNIRMDCIENARFDKFLFIPPEAETIQAFNEIEVQADGSVRASLLTRFQSKNGKIARMITHAGFQVPAFLQLDSSFRRNDGNGQKNDDLILKRESAIMENHVSNAEPENAFIIPADRLYKELVPFAPAYRNIVDHAWLMPDIAGAVVSAAEHETAPGPLGSPFPLDAAFHVACAWSQRFSSIVAFPVGFDRRQIFKPTQTGKEYQASVIPRKTDGAFLMFDINLHAMDGGLCERVSGVRMRDVSGGRVKPPGWVLNE